MAAAQEFWHTPAMPGAEYSPPEEPQAIGQARNAAGNAGAVRPTKDANLPPREIGGPTGPEPTRYGDWEKAGRCIDF